MIKKHGKKVRAVFCDISKVFGRVWHRGLLHKLRGIGLFRKSTIVVQQLSFHLVLPRVALSLKGKCQRNLRWRKCYFSDRRQRVVLNGKFSEWMEVLAGVHQGSILGPLLFLLFINDIVKRIGASIRLFADDTSLYIIVDLRDVAIYSWLVRQKLSADGMIAIAVCAKPP